MRLQDIKLNEVIKLDEINIKNDKKIKILDINEKLILIENVGVRKQSKKYSVGSLRLYKRFSNELGFYEIIKGFDSYGYIETLEDAKKWFNSKKA